MSANSNANKDAGTPIEQPNTRVLPKILGFSIALTLVFTGVANLLPQIEGEAPVEKEIDLGALTPESFAALGENLFMGKGTCTLCHKPAPLGRAPDIQGENMVGLAETALKDERYKGDAKTPEEYIRESMVDPSKFVVKSWGTPGSNDSISPMPKVDAAPIELSAVEVDAIIAYLQNKDGNDITVELPTEAPAVVEKSSKNGGGGLAAPAKTAEAAIKKYGCQACHSMLGTKATIGPSLDDVASRLSRDEIGQSILEPSAVITEGFTDMMPKDFGDQMTVKELSMIVDLLTEKNDSKTDTKAVEDAK
ncbi:MAG TPA: c-type cytochrome [Leucothrix sp.]|nr:c-type cytochrome [Leucothrix sp.]